MKMIILPYAKEGWTTLFGFCIYDEKEDVNEKKLIERGESSISGRIGIIAGIEREENQEARRVQEQVENR